MRAEGVANRHGPAPPTEASDRARRHSLGGGRRALVGMLMAADAIAVATATAIALPGEAGAATALTAVGAAVATALLASHGARLYGRRASRTAVAALDELPQVLAVVLTLAGAGVILGHRLAPGLVSATGWVEAATIAGVGIALLRAAVRWGIRTFVSPDRYLLVSSLADRDGLVRAGRDLDVDQVLLATDAVHRSELVAVVRECEGSSLPVGFCVPRTAAGTSVAVEAADRVAVLDLQAPNDRPWARRVQRGLDIAGALVALALLAPLLAMVAVAIKLTSRGPVLFHQSRVGRFERPFKVVKLRTMVSDAEARLGSLRRHSRASDWLLLDHDPRVTRLGRVLRRTSIDELPQLWNVLAGHMSLVGPRPLVEREAREAPSWARARAAVRPGLTGPWQALGRTEIAFGDMLKLDCAYVATWSLSRELRLLLQTIPAVVRGTGAN